MPGLPAPFLAIDPDGRRVILHPAADTRGRVELRSTAGRVVQAKDYRLVAPRVPVPSDAAAKSNRPPGLT